MLSLSLIFSAGISAAIGVLATALYNAFRAPYPVNRLDFFIRKHLKKGKINGTKFIFERTIEIKEAKTEEIFAILKCEKSGQSTDIFNDIELSDVKLSDGIRNEETVKADLRIKKTQAKLELLFSLNKILPDSFEDDDKVKITMRTIVDDWNYKSVKGLIYDSKEIMNQIMNIIRKQFEGIEVISDIVFFDTKKQPHIVSYLNELREKSDDKNSTLSTVNLKINKYMQAVFYANKCEFINLKSDSDTELLLNAIILYV